MDKLFDKILDLHKKCLVCWANEISTFYPQEQYRKMAREELKRYGYPEHTCKGKQPSGGKDE